MLTRALAVSLAVSAVAFATTASASSLDYNFTFSDSGDNSETVSGFLSFDALDFPDNTGDADDLKPDVVKVESSTIGGVGFYDTTSASGDGFDFESGNIVGADYQVMGSDGSNLDFKLDFGTPGARLSRHVASCTDMYSELQIQSICLDSVFDTRTEIVGVRVEYTRITDVPAVPLPAGFPLMLVGMAGFAALRARRKSS